MNRAQSAIQMNLRMLEATLRLLPPHDPAVAPLLAASSLTSFAKRAARSANQLQQRSRLRLVPPH